MRHAASLRMLGLIAALAAPFTASPAAAQSGAPADGRPSTVLVFDVSNSMWGQIDGVSKIEIAREVIGDLLEDWDPGTDLGLVAYGHRRAGDCSDIQEAIPVGPVDPAAFSLVVNSLVPRGKTPLTEAVRRAAEILNYRDTPATVILVSDGIESCNADPCALAEELERGGVEFTAHVVGFDVGRIEDQRGLSCLAEATGGEYLTAENAGELLDALRTVAAPPPPMLRLEAVAEAGGPPIADDAIRWTVVALNREETVLGGEAMASPELEVGPGRYFARAELGGRAGAVEFDYDGASDALRQVVLAATPALSAPAEAEAGSTVAVEWTGPDAPGDFIALAAPGAAATDFLAYARTSGGSPADVALPETPGEYEIRYVDAGNAKILATAAITATGGTATLDAPPVVEAGAEFDVAWTGPETEGDFVTIVPAGEEEGKHGDYAYARDGSPAALRAPDAPGAYEIRYVAGPGRATLASLPVTVEAAAAALDAPPVAEAGSEIAVAWTGPDNQNDFVTIVPKGEAEGKHGSYAYTRNGSPAKVRAPDDPGAYELRYVTGQARQTLASLPITVTAVEATLEASPTAGAGSEISVAWTGPDNKNDFVTIVPAGEEEGKHGSYAYTRNGSPAKVRAPDDPGAYELRYVTGQARQTLASLPITVTAVEATLEASPTADAGSEISVAWTGPDNKNDFVTIVPAGEEEGKHGSYSYTRKGSPLMVRAPDDPGAYELRYVTGQDRQTLASLPITVTGVEATLEAAPTAGAGSEISVAWTGPDNKNDLVTIVPADEAEGKHGSYAYTRKGSPLTVRAPDDPGAYELRYVTGQDRQTLTSLPISVTEVEASLEAPPTAPAGATIDVAWAGPDNKNDLVTIVPADEEEGKHGPYAYTRKGSPAKLRAPDAPGSYEIRYVTGQSRQTLARLPLSLTAVSASLEAPPVAAAGSRIDVVWTGPGNQGDFIAVAAPDQPGHKRLRDWQTRKGSPASLSMPKDPGQYELRYVTGQDKSVLARLPITVN